MKWYNYKDKWYEFSRAVLISTYEPHKLIVYFSGFEDDYIRIIFESEEERDAEFEKIKALMGIYEHTSRCC